MKTYNDFTTGTAVPITAEEFITALKKKDENGKSLYHWYDDGEYSFVKHRYIRGENNYLFPKASERLSEVYRIHHNDIERQRQQDIRRIPLGLITVPMETEQDGETRGLEIEDERAERDIYAGIERSDLISKLYAVLDELKALDREIVVALYGLGGQAPLSKKACAETLGKNWRTINNAEKRALSKLRELLADFADYDF
jgi:DNA-directed RNA polymerase specialized sigma24 family protein